jgi:hypothetical protein
MQKYMVELKSYKVQSKRMLPPNSSFGAAIDSILQNAADSKVGQ